MPLTLKDQDNIIELLTSVGIDPVLIEIEEQDDLITVKVNIDGDEAGIYIGRFASVLDSLQLIISLFVNAGVEHRHVLLDIGGYRERRAVNLKAIADRVAEEVESSGVARALPPLSSTERRQVHLLFQDHATLTTYSEGQGENRRLFIGKKTA